jgi:N utilization substance protein B
MSRDGAGGAGAERRVEERPRRESRHAAREAAVQMLYQWEVGRLSMVEVVSTYWTPGLAAEEPMGEELRAFATSLARGVADHVGRIDPLIAAAAEHWRIERMAVMDRIILRLAVYEFLEQPETPGRVVINEALELARTFSTDEAVKFINGILDGIRRTLQRE